jgi:hypothetical protein
VAESELSITYADLLVEVSAYLGYGSVLARLTDQQRAECDRHVQAGVRRFYYPPAVEGAERGYPWSFLSPVTTLVTVADQEEQELPGDLGRVLGQFHFDSDQHRCAVPQVSEDRFRAMKATTESSGAPRFACVRHKAKDASRGQRFEVSWWPTPDAAYTLTFRYEAYVSKLSDDNRYPLGGMRHAELLVQSCLAAAEQDSNDESTIHRRDFESLLAAAIEQDRRVGGQFFGAMGDRTGRSAELLHRADSLGTVTYNGTEI